MVEAACLSPGQVDTPHLYGLWHVKLYDGPLPNNSTAPPPQPPRQTGSLLFERHPEYADSLRGTLKLNGNPQVFWLAGDFDEGELILDESDDGQRIAAVWVAHPSATGCGRQWVGNRRMAGENRLQTLVMTRPVGWQ